MQRLSARIPRALLSKLDDRLLEAGALAVDVAPPDDADPDWAQLSVYLEPALHAAVVACLRKRLASLPRAEQTQLVAAFVTRDVDDTWQSQWSEGLEPVLLVPGLVLVPEGTTYEARADERIMVLERGLVFGFGEHPTTRMIATWLASRAKNATILDVGCGTGVLAFVGAHHDAASILGIDIDAASVAAAQRNALRNGWQSVCSFEETPVERVQGQFDVVVANVDALTLERLAAPIASKVAPAGAVALTGILEEQADAVREAFVAYDVHLRVSERNDDWVLLTNDR